MLNKVRLFLLLPIVIIFSLANTAAAQSQPGKKDSINSAILKEKRFIQVVLPEKYKGGSNDKYDVLYVLDGEGNTRTAADVQHFIESESFMPPIIIVGIINVDRNRDFTPTHVADNTTSGGAAPFLGFLKNELIPYVNKTYPSNGNNIIFGHSLGGLFVTYALFNEPQAFDSYLAADPSYWWDKNYLIKAAVEKVPGLANLNKTLYISGRQGQPYKGMGIVGMDSILKVKGPAGFFWKDLAYPDETHGSVRLKSMYDGLKFIYSSYSLKAPEFHPMNGIVLKDKPFKIWYFDDPSKVHYTTDGTKPTLASAKLQSEITLSGPATVAATLFANSNTYNKTTTGEFRAGTYLPAVSKARNFTPGGFHYDYYEGEWDKLPDFKKLKPVKSGRIDTTFNFHKLPRKTNFALLFDGQLEVKEEGYYIFALDSDDGAKLYLGNQLLIDYDGLHGTGNLKSYIVPLTKGFYPLRLEYFQKDGNFDLKLQYLIPSNLKTPQPTPIPFALQYSEK